MERLPFSFRVWPAWARTRPSSSTFFAEFAAVQAPSAPAGSASSGSMMWFWAASADADLGDYDENPTLIFKSGRLPPPFDEM